VLRLTFFVLLLSSLVGSFAASAQDSSSTTGTLPQASVPTTPSPVSAQVTDAEAAIARSDWKTAGVKLDTWLTEHPSDARALFDAGYVADAQNRLDDAAGLYRRATAANPKSFEAHLSLGLLLARQDNFNEAHPELITATQLDPGEAGPEAMARAWRALARIDRPKPGSGTDPSTASNDLLQALKLSPETPEDTLLAASLAEDSGDIDAAEAAYHRILDKDPTSEPANAGMAHCMIQKKQYSDAEKLLRSALQHLPDDPALNAQLATVLVDEDNPDAVPVLEKLHQAHPADDNITRMLAAVMADAGNYAGSDQLYLKLLAANPENPDLLEGHAEDLIRQLKYAEAFVVFDKVTQLAPSNAEAWSGLAFTASRTGRPTVTLHALTMRSKYLPENPSTYFLWATAYDTLHQKAQAIAYYHHFLEASAGKFADEEWQAHQRLQLLEK
jgi:predicted Zn-dependent protease